MPTSRSGGARGSSSSGRSTRSPSPPSSGSCARQLELGPIDSKPFSAFIRKRFRGAGKDVAPEVTAELLDRSGGHPYATQEFCYFLWEATSPGEVAGFPEFERALTALLRSENTHFTLLWDEASSRS